MGVQSSSRRADLDWLRVGAFGLLIFYHAGMAWSGWDWIVTSGVSIDWLLEVMRFLNRWRMPLIFVVSGAAIHYALGTHSVIDFAFDRIYRLLLPLAFGMAFLCPPQDYLSLVHNGQFNGSFWSFLSAALTGPYPGGKLHSHHLWFLGYVLVLTFVLLPVFLWLRGARGRLVHAKVAKAVAGTGLHWLMPIPLAGALLWLSPISSSTNAYSFLGPWYGLTYYGVLLLYGAFIFGSSDMLGALNRQRFFSLGLGIALYAILYVVYIRGDIRPDIRKSELPAYTLVSTANTMAWLFAIIGFANRHLTAQSAFLRQATQAVLPLYLLHQTFILIAVYHLLRLGSPPIASLILTVTATILGTGAIYLLVLGPLWFVRPLFGLKLPPRGNATASLGAPPSDRMRR